MKFHILFILALTGLAARTEKAWSEELLLKEALETALAKNPDIEAFHRAHRAAASRVGAEQGYDSTKIFFESMYSGRERTIGVSQDIPFPGKLTLRGAVARREADMAEQALRSKELDVAAKVRAAYAMLYLARKSIDIYEESAGLVRHFAKAAEAKYASGKAGQVDALKAQMELAKIQNALVALEQEKETAQAMLNILMNQDPETPLGTLQEPKLMDLKLEYLSLSQAALANRPELRESLHHVHHFKAALRSARFNYLPDFMVQARRRSADNPEMDGSSDFMIGATVPLWVSKPYGNARAAKLEAEKSEAEFQSVKNMTLWTLKDLLAKVQAAKRLVELYRTSVIPLAENALKVTQAAYLSDRSSLLDLIDVQRNYLQFRLEHHQHLAEYEKSLAELEQIVGIPLSEVKQ